jgi:hypothetical protein
MEHSATESRASSLGRSACLNANSMISSFFTIFGVLAVLLATHFNGQPLTCGSWSPTSSAGTLKTWFEECEGYYKDYYSSEEPRDYWAQCGYSRYDGI